MSLSTTPSYNIQVVLRETGLKADALRVWEKRYGLPNPARSEGGHRLYSEYDIELVKWLQARKKEGVSISKAVKLFQDMEEQGENPLLAHSPESVGNPVSGRQLDEIRNDFVQACRNFNENQAEAMLSQAFALYPAESVGVELMQKSLAEIGSAWFENELTIAQEHFASNLIIRKLNAVLAAAPAPTRSEKILIANPTHERHIFSGLLISLILRNRGWGVIQLGANLPAEEILAAVESTKPKAVILIAMQLLTAANLVEVASQLAQAGLRVGFGGLAFQRFEGLELVTPGIYLGDSLAQIGERVEALLKAPVSDSVASISFDKELLASFQENRGHIDANLLRAFGTDEKVVTFVTLANEQFGNDIAAAIRLGDLDYLNQEIRWVKELLAKRTGVNPPLPEYLKAYHDQVVTHLGPGGKGLANWLRGAVEQA